MNKKNGDPKTTINVLNSNNIKYPITIKERVEYAEQLITPNTCRHVLQYVYSSNSHPWTHEISSHCACINVPDAVRKMRFELAKAGLTLSCYLPEKRLLNRFGSYSSVNRWRLGVL